MDQCVKYWLYFEEKLTSYKKIQFVLPDVFPDHLLEDINLKSENTDFLPEISSDCNKSTVSGKQFFLKLESEQGIDSFRKGLGFWDLAMLEEAIHEFEKVVKIEPNFIFGHFCLGLAYSQKGLYNQALSKLRLVKALNHDPHLNALFITLSVIFANERQYEALYEFSLSVEEDPFYIGYLIWRHLF